jgi:Transglutaminase-like superfamily
MSFRQLLVIPRGDAPLPPPQRIVLTLEILWTYCTVRWAIRGDDLPGAVARLRRDFEETASATSPENDRHGAASRLGYVVSSVLRLLPTDSRCLMRSLVLTRLLARRGVPSTLIIGVSAAPEFAAHAWVEHAGRPLLPSYGPMFARLVEL